MGFYTCAEVLCCFFFFFNSNCFQVLYLITCCSNFTGTEMLIIGLADNPWISSSSFYIQYIAFPRLFYHEALMSVNLPKQFNSQIIHNSSFFCHLLTSLWEHFKCGCRTGLGNLEEEPFSIKVMFLLTLEIKLSVRKERLGTTFLWAGLQTYRSINLTTDRWHLWQVKLF